jgi:basic membrane protein A
MRTRKWFALVALLSVFALIAAACGDGEADETTTTTAAETTTTAADMIGEGVLIGMAYDVGGRGDLSFNDLAAKAWDDGKAMYGYEGSELEPTSGGENREENLRLLIDGGHNMIIANGFAFNQNVGRVGQEFPEVFFSITDDCALAEDFSLLDLPNVACVLFAEEQGSFLVGVAAGRTTETNTVGFIGGVETDLIKKFEAGFVAGVEAVNPDAEILIRYLTQAPDFSGFTAPELGKEAALAEFQQGADVIYHAAGLSGLGLFEATKEVNDGGTTAWAIGVDADQYNVLAETAPGLEQYVLTSMLKRVDVGQGTVIRDFLEGNFQSGENRFDLSVDGVGYSTSGGFLSAELQAEMEEFKAKIISGEIVVPTAP